MLEEPGPLFAFVVRGDLLTSAPVSRFSIIFVLLLATGLAGELCAETYKMANGETMTGEALLSSANDQGLQIKLGEGKYERVPWPNFAQEELKKFAQNPKLEPYVEPLIEITQEERLKKTEVVIKQPQRLPQPAAQSLIGAMFSSGLGLFILALIYAANIYAGYEVAIFRAQSVPLVCGVSAVAPIVGPIAFLSMRTNLPPSEPAVEMVPAEGAVAGGEHAAKDDSVNPMLAEGAAHPAGLKIHTEPEEKAETKPTVYQRGQFTFNRRFFETKFPHFFAAVRREEDRHLVLVIKSPRGEYVGERISRIAANDLHLEVHPHGRAVEEVMIPFQEIQEIRLQPRKV